MYNGKELFKRLLALGITISMLSGSIMPVKAAGKAENLLNKTTTTTSTSLEVADFSDSSKAKDGVISSESRWAAGLSNADKEYYLLTHFDKKNSSNKEKVKTVVVDWYAKNFDYYYVKRRTGSGWESPDNACKVLTDRTQPQTQNFCTVERGEYRDVITFHEPIDAAKFSIVVPQAAFRTEAVNVFGEQVDGLTNISITEYAAYNEGTIPPPTVAETAYEIEPGDMTVETTENQLSLPPGVELNGYRIDSYHSDRPEIISSSGGITTPKDNVRVNVSVNLRDDTTVATSRAFTVYVKGTSGKDEKNIRVNYARNKETSAGATSEEAIAGGKTRGAALAIDGIIDSDHRWASVNNAGIIPLPEVALTVDLGSPKLMGEVELYWQRQNIQSFKVEASTDRNSWQEIYSTSTPLTANTLVTKIPLSSPVEARYVKISSDNYNDTTLSGGTGGTTSVSLQEVKIFDKKFKPGMIEISDTASARDYVVNHSTTTGKIGLDTDRLDFSEVPGYQVEVCADYEQVIGRDGRIHRPLTDQTIKYLYKVSDGDNKSESSEYTVTVQGQFADAGVNEKPKVIPEMAEWHGDTGEFKMPAGSRIVYADDSFLNAVTEFKNDLLAMNGTKIEIVKGNDGNPGDFIFRSAAADSGLGKEGYRMEVSDKVIIDAETPTGAYYSTRTILQILQQTGDTIKKGMAKDYPKYEIRGFMLDVARKPFKLDTVKQIAKALSWYKLNDYQIHLNDNYAKMEKHLKNPNSTNKDEIEAIMDSTLSAFRLESNEAGLTSQDQSYSKKEFGQLIDASQNIGINIVPEFDVPGHSLAFLKNHKNLYYKGNIEPDPWESVAPYADRIAMFDVENPDSVNYIKNLFSEYIDDGTFRDSVIHIGADEYYGSKESYRKFVDEMLKYITETKGRQARVWGSLSAKSGTTPVYNKNIQMNIWNYDWAKPGDMVKQGYNIINTNDCETYIVPGGNWYHDYLNNEYIYNTYEPNRFVNDAKKYIYKETIPAGNEQMLGACFAVWNDGVDLSANGINEYEVSKRILSALPAISVKMWGDGGNGKDLDFAEFEALSGKVKNIPEVNLLYEVPSKTDKVVDYNFDHASLKDHSQNGYDAATGKARDAVHADLTENALKLNGGSSYVETGMKDLGPVNHLQVSVKRANDSDESEQILLESDQGTIKAVQKTTGQVGYSRDGYDYSFNYKLPKDVWTDLGITCDDKSVKLFVNGDLVDKKDILQTITDGADPYKTNQSIHQVGPNRFEDYPTLVLPLERIGSKDKAFKGMVDNFKVYNKTVTDVDYQELLSKVAGLNITDYTAESWNELERSVADNQLTVTSTTTQKEIDTAIKNIKAAYNKLKVNIDDGLKKGLEEKIASIEAMINSEKYEEAGILNLKVILQNAKDLLSGGNFTNADLQDALSKLKEEEGQLQLKEADKAGLKKAIDAASKLDLGKYTQESADKLRTALKQAQELLDKGLTIEDQKAVDHARDALNQAVKDLIPISEQPNKSQLFALIDKADSIMNADDYTAGSFAALKAEIENARLLIQKQDATEQDIQAAIQALQKALDGLVKKPGNVGTSEPQKPGEAVKPGKPSQEKPGKPPIKLVETGDKANAGVLIVVMLACMAAIGAAVVRKRRMN